ncbi:condensation domain-containing protein [Paenibacillus marchantiae]|uniref:condensation domain-containing protein n=1 Tax=Paenibacillus marchantiae TaxID=3026433 RepID=UPI00237AAF9C|nr:condensation domain-containing protein [Paenibacillus marchantiae]WDQ32368.1 condensation domain-containing protein [Paenibacillus marchantiae]
MIKLTDLNIKPSNAPLNEMTIQKMDNKDIAIIGMEGYFPGADSLDEFWANLREGKDLIGELPEYRKKDVDDYLKYKNIENPQYVKAGFLNQIDKFDYPFFGLSPAEAKAMDPNQRLFLEVAWRAIEDAGYGGRKLRGSETGVYLGFSGNAGGLYQDFVQDIAPELENVAGSLNAIIASRISYVLDLKGPSMVIDTSCSSSLVAIHTAVRAIRNGDCTAAICGGVNLSILPTESQSQIGIESSTSRIRAFAEGADGTVSGEGVAALILKPLLAAKNDGDHIYAIIKGSAINQDGRSAGITTPNVTAQEEVLIKAWKDARIDPSTLSYIETHGTGTKIGDPIEVEALTKAMRRFTDQKQFCAIGSLKSNIGHLDGTAGIAGVIKSVLSLKRRAIPSSLHFDSPNELIDFINSPFYVNRDFSLWEAGSGIRRCGISAFGMSGTNCHLVLEEYVENEQKSAIIEKTSQTSFEFLTISAHNYSTLVELMNAYALFLSLNPDVDLKALCYTINTGRGQYAERVLIMFHNYEDLVQRLESIRLNPQNNKIEHVYYTNPAAEAPLLFHPLALSDSVSTLLHSYLQGDQVQLESLYEKPVPKISLPVYPFERIRCWLDVTNQSPLNNSSNAGDADTIQQKVIQIWKEVLGYSEINVDANFYDLGGDSIFALKIINKLRDQLHIDLEISQLLVSPTLYEFASYIESQWDKKQMVSLDHIHRTHKKEEFIPLTYAQRGIYYALQRTKINTSYNMPGSLDIYGTLDVERVERSLQELVLRHSQLHASFHYINDMAMQRIEKHDLVIEYLHLEPQSTMESLYRNFVRPFDITSDFLFRVAIVKCAETHHCLFFDVHHLVSDGVSMNILMEDFVDLYHGHPIESSRYTYEDYINWQKGEEGKQTLRKQQQFWRGQFKDGVPLLDMPTDFSRPNVRKGTGQDLRMDIPTSLIRKIKDIAHEEQTTSYTVLLSIYVLLLHKYAGQEDLVVGTPTSGRSRSEWDRIVGMFVNTLALRMKINKENTFRVFLQSIRKTVHDALNNQSYPFELLVEELDYSTPLNRNPLFDTMFIMQNNKSSIGNIDDLSFISKPFVNDTAKFDFKMEIYEQDEQMTIVFDYSTELYHEATVKAWLDDYIFLIDQTCGNMDQRIVELELTGSEKSKQTMINFNDDLT